MTSVAEQAEIKDSLLHDMKAIIQKYRTHLSIVIVVVLGVLGFIALNHLLHEVRLRDVKVAVAALPMHRIALAALFTAVSYTALTFYDVLALRTIGRPLPYRTAAVASFTSYTLSHNLGLALITGGSARYRVYNAAGLGVGDVARIVTITGLTFWGGVLSLAGLMLAFRPQALDLGTVYLTPTLLRTIGVVMLIAIATLLVWSGPKGRTLSLSKWSLPIPGFDLALTQIAVAVIDLAAASGALFLLVPGVHLSDWPVFFVGYTLAIIIVLVTHVPGGLGVFEAVMVAALPTVNQPALVAALLVYRLIYYIAPLLLSIGIITLEEGSRWRHPFAATFRGAQAFASGLAPTMISVLVFLGGMVLLVSGSLPALQSRTKTLVELLPLPFMEASHMAASLAGAALLVLAPGLYKRLDGAFWLTRLVLLAGAVFSLSKGLDYEEATVMLVIAGLLQWTRPAFYRRTKFTADALTPGWLATVAIAIGLSIWIGFFAYKHVAYNNDLWWHVAQKDDPSKFLRASFSVAVFLVAVAFWRLLRPASARPAAGSTSEMPGTEMLALADRTDANLAYTGDKQFLVSASGQCFVMYAIQGHSWIVMGDPVGIKDEWDDLLWQLREQADAAQGRLILYQISLDVLPIAIDLGLQIVKYGEEALIDLHSFTLEGPAAKQLRYADRRAVRDGAIFEIIPAARLPEIIEELEAISTRWLRSKGNREKGFSIGRFEQDYVSRFDCAVVKVAGRIVAFANVWKTANKTELSTDLMRHDDEMPYGTMDYLFLHLILWGKSEGYGRFNIGMAPLAGLEARRLAPLWSKLGSLLYKHGEALYGFEGLRVYKEKFSPMWEPRFIAGPQGLSMGRGLMDLQALIGSRR